MIQKPLVISIAAVSGGGKTTTTNQLISNREDESRLVERIRLSEGFIPDLSLVAEENDRIVGHALFSKAEIERKGDMLALRKTYR